MTDNATGLPSDPIFSSFGSDPDMAELVELFVSELPDRVEAIRSAAHQGRLSDLRILAHNMKGAAGGYGFGVLSDAAAAVEGPLRTGAMDLNSVRSKVDELVNLCGRASAGGECED